MAAFEPKQIVLSQLNNGTGQEYNSGDGIYASDINDAIEASAWAQNTSTQANSSATQALNYANALTDPPDLTDVANVGTPSVSFVDNGSYKKFKFSNLKGQTGDKGDTGKSIKDVDFIYKSETSTETIYDVKTTLEDDTVVDSGQVTIPKATIPVISEFAAAGQDTPSDDLMIGGLFFTEATV